MRGWSPPHLDKPRDSPVPVTCRIADVAHRPRQTVARPKQRPSQRPQQARRSFHLLFTTSPRKNAHTCNLCFLPPSSLGCCAGAGKLNPLLLCFQPLQTKPRSFSTSSHRHHSRLRAQQSPHPQLALVVEHPRQHLAMRPLLPLLSSCQHFFPPQWSWAPVVSSPPSFPRL